MDFRDVAGAFRRGPKLGKKSHMQFAGAKRVARGPLKPQGSPFIIPQTAPPVNRQNAQRLYQIFGTL